jgi:transcriptional regulator with XRE-family HTH domain
MSADYSRAFRVIRAASGLKQAELAARIPITASQLSLIEAGKRMPSVKVVEGVAKALNIPATLVTLLASSAADVEGKGAGDIAALSGTLLRALLSVDKPPHSAARGAGA